MRVIGGKARRYKLKTIEGMSTRPTTDRIKETIFNMIQFEIQGKVFLDLFSGSGAIGIEALSREAEKCYFVEKSKVALEIIKENLEHTNLLDNSIIKSMEVDKAICDLNEKNIKIDIIFMDPPYDKGYIDIILKKIEKYDILEKDGIIIIESSRKEEFDINNKYEVYKQKKYNTTKITMLKYR